MATNLSGTQVTLGSTTLNESSLKLLLEQYYVPDEITVGSPAIFEGIECLCINVNPTIFVDKNHDLSYYVNGSDWVDSRDYNVSPGTFGYEWGAWDIETGITATAVGTGLSNTNSLIEMNLQPYTSGWYVIWDKIREFRQNHSDQWFLPSKDELNLVYETRSNLSNLSTSNFPIYRSSTETTSFEAGYQSFATGYQADHAKNNHTYRCRLCRAF